MSEEVHINVGGVIFTTKWSTLQKYQDTRLGSLSFSSEHYNEERQYFFFDRNPEFFNTILDFYRNGHIHFPTHICGWVWKQELEFWKIPVIEISECCYPTYIKYDKDKIESDRLKQSFTVQTAEYKTKHVPYSARIKQSIWLFLDEPTSSIFARIFSMFYLAIVVLSAVVPILATHPDIRIHVRDLQRLTWWVQTNGLQFWINTNNPKEVQFVTTEIPKWLRNLELIITVFFSFESILRFLFCPRKCRFFKDWLNILDITLFLAMWFRFILEQFPKKLMENLSLTICFAVCYSVVAFRLLRFFRITKQYSGLRILVLATKASMKELCLLMMTFAIFVLLFSNIIYFAELRDPETFPDMLIGLWWAVVTMTTVGYGDIVPKSALGRVVGSICAMLGMFLLAMPIAVIAGKFNDLYKKNEEREEFNKLHAVNKRQSILHKINTIFAFTNGVKHEKRTGNNNIIDHGIVNKNNMTNARAINTQKGLDITIVEIP